MKKTADSKASDVLKRITGLTVMSDKYVFVRGLSERYSNTQLNSSALSSPEPDKKVVPFDIFPSNLLDNIVVTKSFLPSLPGDFAGGSIRLTTKEFTENKVKFSASLGYNSGSTFNDFYTYKGGKLDLLGFDDGIRALPEQVRIVSENQEVVESGQFSGGFSSEEIEALGESFSNIWNPSIVSAPVNQSYSLSGGNEVELFNRPLGIIASLTYKSNYSYREEERFYYIQGAEDLEARLHYEDFKVSNMNIQWGNILNLNYKLSPFHKIGIKTTFTQTADDEVISYGMYPNRDHNLDEKATRLRWVDRSVFSSELTGNHKLSLFDSKVDWRANYSLAKRNEPDRRDILFESEIGLDSFRLADESNSGSRFFSYLNDHVGDFGLDIELPFKQWFSLPAKFKMGGNFTYKKRNIDSRRFRFKPQDFHEVNIYQDPEGIFRTENIGSDGFQLEEDTRPTDNYKAKQMISAGYAMVDMPFWVNMRFTGGFRIENSDQKVTTYELFNPEAAPVIGEVNNTDFLPSLNLTYKMTSDMNLRLGFSQTISRPSFRELSKFEFTDIGGHAIYGNPNLKRSLIHNFDCRWELYPGIAEYISAAFFYKRFKNPIEKTLEDRTEPVSTWENAESAHNYGMELEIRKSLGFVAPLLSAFNIAGNFTVIKSKVKLEDVQEERALQGQSPYVVNLALEYKNEKSGTEIVTIYNVFGPRITAVGIATTPDIYEESFHKVDATLIQHLNGHIELKLKAKNLLDSEVLYTQGDKKQRFYREGRSYSCGFSCSF
jgi:outer membrane receptor protein involved in Fe transport